MYDKRWPLIALLGIVLCLGSFTFAHAQAKPRPNQFQQLYQELPTPNEYRTASGAPGPKYWQQQADYDIAIELDDETHRIAGTETITYHNNSPNPLSYLWIQLDQNMRALDSTTQKIQMGRITNPMYFSSLDRIHNDFEGGFNIEYVKDAKGRNLKYTIVNTMMRVDLPTALKPNAQVSLRLKWDYNINDSMRHGGRSSYDLYEKDGNCVYTIAQFYPRMAVYNETEGWQNRQFLGSSEFAVPFGNFKVSITAPADHIIGATGELQNSRDVLTSNQISRLEKAKSSVDVPVIIASKDEAVKNEKKKESATKTWVFKADNVRDFGFASSRKFIWDAMAVKFGSRTVMAMSYYPKEVDSLWSRYSTQAVAHALRVYSKHTFDYPYPAAISVFWERGGGMEYPMISFNGGKPEADGTYSQRTKYSMIGVIIHEVGHNFFPMIVNSDERQWGWMDEGLNTFMEYLSEQEWDRTFSERDGTTYSVIDYMKGDKKRISPIMTDIDSVFNGGANAYGKTSTGLNILRETILGRELFDYAFKEYARRWMFKHPTPADFFRTMEDASGIDLDWFWRGWFFRTDHVDLALDEVKWYKINTREPELNKSVLEERFNRKRKQYISNIRNRKDIAETAVEKNPALEDFYDEHDLFEVTPLEKKQYREYIDSLTPEEKALLNTEVNYYELSFSNIGGMVMPLILEFEYTDGSTEEIRIPADIWRRYNDRVFKVFATEKELRQVTLDPHLETPDVDYRNNVRTVVAGPDYFEVTRRPPRRKPVPNLMQKVKK